MVITQTPFRMSFFGGGTDYPPFFEKYGGSVLSSTFDKYCYVTVRNLPRFFEYRNQITYGIIERTNTVEEIEHPAVRNALQMMNMQDLRIGYDADLPARSGLGSSSAFSVGMLHGLHALLGNYVGKYQLAEEAIHLERVLCDEAGGWQDQIASAFGGLNRIDFLEQGFIVHPVIISPQRKRLFESHLMLFFTGFSRLSGEIAQVQTASIKDKTAELLDMLALVDEGEKALTGDGAIEELGRLLDAEWKIKRSLTHKVSNDSIDGLYQKAMDAGAIGGKLMGAGGGGFLMVFAQPDRQEAVKAALRSCLYVPFSFENTGTRVMYFNLATQIND